ncbi:hypothetical protein HMPREF2912_11295 [Corynebacterium sp. HMSC056E09]|uniref:restriction endonuclease subunit S n=1 Tax=Corynebacterium sp. HMSC056E09 TaxID=1739416 RepID=UPI0008A5A340|nr:restriction endonuclease subunit S [Corynebacterium sp. HMSC056E09]OFQ93729.1 hypothetical protein HMPREF2912_11295 [Corynebacterium sp. HMSC056E09]
MAQLQDIFDIRSGHSLEKIYLDDALNSEGVNFVSRTAKNNGVSGRVVTPDEIVPANTGEISVALGGTVLATFVQDEPFVCGRDVAILTAKTEMGLAEKLWWCAVIEANKPKYSFGRQANRTLKFLEVPDSAPQHIIDMGDEIPNVFGEVWNFTKDIVDELPPLSRWGEFGIDERFAESEPVGERVELPPFSEWKPFRVGDLFTVERGKSVRMLDLDEGETPVVSATNQNNGVAGIFDIEPNRDGGFISVSANGAVGFTAVQTESCFVNGDAVTLVPLQTMGYSTLAFIAVVLYEHRHKYSYGRKANPELIRSATVGLPVAQTGEPDFDLIERYIGGGLRWSSWIDSTCS